MNQRRLARSVLVASGAVFVVGTAGMLKGVEPFAGWYYCFAWWPFILGAESALHLRDGRSLLFDHPGRFLALLPLSATLWLVFEALNFRLGNWQYLNLPAGILPRWAGYLVSFATVLPAIFTTEALLEDLGLFRTLAIRPLAWAGRARRPLFCLGLACLALPLLWPRFFFPLVWGGFFLLLDPLNRDAGRPSILADLARGDARRPALLLAAGLVCGGLWELWNFWAASKWRYVIPLVGEPKLFEMPVLGFLGFPPFALECLAMTEAARGLAQGLYRLPAGQRALVWTICVATVVVFDAIVLWGVDRFTVVSFAR